MQFTGRKQSDFVILMKITSRSRPDQLLRVVKLYKERASNPVRLKWLFSFDSNDDSVTELLLSRLNEILSGFDVQIVKGESDGKIDAINRDVNQFPHDWDILLNISDDQIPEIHGYDEIIRLAMPTDLDASLWFFDGAQPRINTMECQGRAYYERLKYIYNPCYKSFYCDNEATEVAQRLGKLIKSERCIIRHHHPAIVRTVQNDALYDKNQKYWDQDKAMFNKRRQENFI
jgi:hypothetical protein